MNEEELRKEATATVEWECTPMIDRPTFINGYIVGAKPREKQIAKLKEENIYYKDIIETNTAEWEEQGQRVFILEKENAALKDEVHTWKEASSANSYKAFQLQEENKTLSTHIVELQNDKGDLTDRCKKLEAQIEKMKCLDEEIIKALKESEDCAWLHCHNGKAKYLYLQSAIDIVRDKFEEIKEK